MLHGADNQVHLVVLDVLIRKARTIRRQLGISVPVPVESEQVVQAVVDTVLLRSSGRTAQLQLGFTDPEVSRFHQEWDRAAEKEGRQRAHFAQQGIQPDEVEMVTAYCDAILGKALAPEPDPRFARCGAIYTDTVGIRTAVILLRLRYRLRDRVDEYAEEVLLAAFRREAEKPVWIEPLETAGRELLERAEPVANMPGPERESQVGWALDLLAQEPSWYEPLIAWRKSGLQESNDRLRRLVRARSLEIIPHTPPDILGCYVLVPGGGE